MAYEGALTYTTLKQKYNLSIWQCRQLLRFYGIDITCKTQSRRIIPYKTTQSPNFINSVSKYSRYNKRKEQRHEQRRNYSNHPDFSSDRIL